MCVCDIGIARVSMHVIVRKCASNEGRGVGDGRWCACHSAINHTTTNMHVPLRDTGLHTWHNQIIISVSQHTSNHITSPVCSSNISEAISASCKVDVEEVYLKGVEASVGHFFAQVKVIAKELVAVVRDHQLCSLEGGRFKGSIPFNTRNEKKLGKACGMFERMSARTKGWSAHPAHELPLLPRTQ